jgi:hypothetical protein
LLVQRKLERRNGKKLKKMGRSESDQKASDAA